MNAYEIFFEKKAVFSITIWFIIIFCYAAWSSQTSKQKSITNIMKMTSDKVFRKQTPGPDRSPLLYCQ